jgi:hypothetical protein
LGNGRNRKGKKKEEIENEISEEIEKPSSAARRICPRKISDRSLHIGFIVIHGSNPSVW